MEGTKITDSLLFADNNGPEFLGGDPVGPGTVDGGVPGDAGTENGVLPEVRPVNSKGVPYPKIIDPRTGEEVPFPDGDLQKVPRSERVSWNRQTRADYIREWYQAGYPEPNGGWGIYDIHHILPKEYGGTNDFWNLVPIDSDFHDQVVTPWWKAYNR